MSAESITLRVWTSMPLPLPGTATATAVKEKERRRLRTRLPRLLAVVSGAERGPLLPEFPRSVRWHPPHARKTSRRPEPNANPTTPPAQSTAKSNNSSRFRLLCLSVDGRRNRGSQGLHPPPVFPTLPPPSLPRAVDALFRQPPCYAGAIT
ncbi:hypothetical protein B296_00034646, partial [Ensete ventricosum]